MIEEKDGFDRCRSPSSSSQATITAPKVKNCADPEAIEDLNLV